MNDLLHSPAQHTQAESNTHTASNRNGNTAATTSAPSGSKKRLRKTCKTQNCTYKECTGGYDKRNCIFLVMEGAARSKRSVEVAFERTCRLCQIHGCPGHCDRTKCPNTTLVVTLDVISVLNCVNNLNLPFSGGIVNLLFLPGKSF